MSNSKSVPDRVATHENLSVLIRVRAWLYVWFNQEGLSKNMDWTISKFYRQFLAANLFWLAQ
jgi:hypothetical protein